MYFENWNWLANESRRLRKSKGLSMLTLNERRPSYCQLRAVKDGIVVRRAAAGPQLPLTVLYWLSVLLSFR